MAETIQIFGLSDFNLVKNRLIFHWIEREGEPNVFRYKLNIREKAILDGRFNFFVELNTERATLRRVPELITSVVPPFDEQKFNFNKINPKEILLECENYLHSKHPPNRISFLINNSPLTKYHSLICPNRTDNLSQILTKESIEFAIDTIYGFNDRQFRIGFNSPGGFASVNHLHLHLVHVKEKLYIEDACIHHIIGNVFALNDKSPTIGFCFPIQRYEDKFQISSDVQKLVEYFCANVMPYNVVWILGSNNVKRDDTSSSNEIVKIFVFPKKTMADKINSVFNVACLEQSGYVSLGDESAYKALTEEYIIEKIKETNGDIDRKKLIEDVVALYS